MSEIFSSKDQLTEISKILVGYLKLPFSGDSIPGALMENIIASVHSGEVLNTYDFVDVLNKEKSAGWQVKSTKASTPVTWKRAKIPNSEYLIGESQNNEEGLQALGDSIIKFCNDHAAESMEAYGIEQIGFARLIVHNETDITYFEKLICSKENPKIFEESDFVWKWSTPKKTKKKEQLPALHGVHKGNNSKWFAWHGLGENQLHFSGEKQWWPSEQDDHRIDFKFPTKRLSQNQLMDFLAKISSQE